MTFTNVEKDDFHDVEYASSLASPAKFYIENTSSSNLFVTIGLLFLFIFVHVIAASFSPPVISYTKQYYPLNKTDPNSTLELDLTLTPLIELHRFLYVNGSIVRKEPLEDERELSAKFVKNVVLSKDAYDFKAEDHQKLTLHLKFEAGQNTTEQFPLLAREIKYYDTVQIKMSVTTDLTNIIGFEFSWAYSDPNGIKYSNTSRVLLAFLVGYMLILFFNSFQITTEQFTQYFCILIGFSAIVSSNPLNIFYPTITFIQILDSLLVSSYVAIFRVFIFSQFEMIRTKKSEPSKAFLIIISILMAFIAIVEATARLNRRTFTDRASAFIDVVLPIETYLYYLDFLYVFLNVVWVVLAFVKSTPSLKLYYFAFISFLQCVAVLFSQVYCVSQSVLMYTIMPFIIYISVHMTTTAFTLYALRNDEKPVYTQIMGDKGPSVLDVNRASDNSLDFDDDDDNDDEEDEEEEEE